MFDCIIQKKFSILYFIQKNIRIHEFYKDKIREFVAKKVLNHSFTQPDNPHKHPQFHLKQQIILRAY